MSIISKIRLWWIFLIIGILGHIFASAQCSSPYGLDFNSITQQSVRVTWLDNNASKLSFDIDISPKGINSDGIPDYQIQGNTTSFTINALVPSTTYQIYLRTKCSNGNWSAWNGPFLFTTLLSNPTLCGTSLELKDNGQEVFYIDVAEDGKLGTDIFLESIDLIIDHGWPADLKISLISPGQKQVVLSEHHGTITDHFGDPKDATCQKYCQFSDDGCTFLETEAPPFIGTFKPDQPLYTFEDQSSPKGLWQLIIQDRAVFDNGILKYVRLRFSKQKCQTPEQIFIDGINATSAVINWQKKTSCQTVKIIVEECDKPQISRKEYFVDCNDQKFKIPALFPDRCYNVALSAVCGSQLSLPSCQSSFNTRCKSITIEENFNAENNCIEGCQFSCNLSGYWKNSVHNSQDWISWSGPTDSDQTGPSGDISGNGKYLYIENQPSICTPGQPVVLESPCILVNSSFDGCDMSFFTHMYGLGIQSIKLEASDNGGLSWQEIFNKDKETGINWIRNILDLSSFDKKNVQMKFTAYTSQFVTGDIALDQIEFYGSTIQEKLSRYYLDEDNDGYGNAQLFTDICSASPPSGYVNNALDCNDANSSVHPGAVEITCNLIDENCNGPEDDLDSANTLEVDYTVTSASCFGNNDGTIELHITGGIPPYTIVWNTGSTQSRLDSLHTGFYFANVTDALGCKAETDFINLQAISNIQLSISAVIKPSCTGKSDGQIFIDHSGGLPPFSYQWSDGSTGKNLENAGAGNYKVTIYDASGCSFESTLLELTPKTQLQTGIVNIKEPRCHDRNDGVLQIAAFGGLAPYQYTWNNGTQGNMISGLTPGTYKCTITDKNGCLHYFESNLKGPQKLEPLIVSVEPVRCFGESNGSIKINTSGGSQPYTYFWNNGRFEDDIFNLKKGHYHLTVTDKNGCQSKLDSIKVDEPDKLIVKTDSIKYATCISGKDGAIYLSASGGISPYNFLINDKLIDLGKGDSLAAGIYYALIVDRNNCKSSYNTIDLPFINKEIKTNLNITKLNRCAGDKNAAIEVNVLNGKAPYDFNWNFGKQFFTDENKLIINQLPSGNYRLTITDSDGCMGISPIIDIPAIKNITYAIQSIEHNICKDDATGILNIELFDTQGQSQIYWEDGQTGINRFNLKNGIYSGIIRDSQNCTAAVDPVRIISDSDINVLITSTNTDVGKKNGKFCLDIQGGITPYSINWDEKIKNVNIWCVDSLDAGKYNLKITDAIGCSMDTMVEIDLKTNSADISELIFSVYPNPAMDFITFKTIAHYGKAIVYSIRGEELLMLDVSNDERFDISHLKPGIYMIQLKSGLTTAWLKLIKI